MNGSGRYPLPKKKPPEAALNLKPGCLLPVERVGADISGAGRAVRDGYTQDHVVLLQ